MKTWIPDARKFAYLTWKQVEALPKDKTLLVLPTGAIEQHGHHLPLATDTLTSNLLLGRALQLLPADAPIYALETICYGKSNEHIGFPGTMTLSAATYMAVLRDIGASVAAAGIKKLLLFNTHGGNSSLNDVMARDLRAEFGLRTFHMSGGAGAKAEGLSPQEAKYGFHAGEVETAWLLAATPELVKTDAYTTNYIARIEENNVLSPENGAVNFAWLTRDISPSGVLGDPRPATAENGERWIAACAEKAAAALMAAYEYENHYKP
ncbi:creatininase family protein [Granulicella sp. 5B5]|uniref:creatininase family protein n=1 Tax=Granulicella sp. 5B5 TaxID=1617967 RepID=UPI0015F72C7A|nr:creatininase family protein [Granulicella sp. 5B5]QMV19466.1 creatininase family protein [Granulicella sp. 5B5]